VEWHAHKDILDPDEETYVRVLSVCYKSDDFGTATLSRGPAAATLIDLVSPSSRFLRSC
jgi:hypothetical protein